MKFQVFGRSNRGTPTIVLSAGLGGSHHFWKPQIEALQKSFRLISYDHRGTGVNAEPLPENYSVDQMANDVLGIIDAEGIESIHFIGHALGALVGLEFARKNPDRIKSLICVNGWITISKHTRRCFDTRCELLLASGVEAYVKAQPIFLYPAAWLEAHAEEIEREEKAGILNFQGIDNLLRRINALLKFDANEWLHDLCCPLLVAASRDDVLVPWTCSKKLADVVENSTLWITQEGGHGFTAVDPNPFNERVADFISRNQ